MRAATGGAMYRRPDGIVIIDPDKAAGQRDIVSACPYGAVFWNEARNLPQKCTFCAHLLDDGWKEPRCVEACPVQALVFGDLNDPVSDVARLTAEKPIEALAPKPAEQPPVGYLGLPACFIAGEVVLGDNTEECPEGVTVRLHHGQQTATASTDNYGDFEFNNLKADTQYVLSIEHAGYRSRELRVHTGTDPNVGTIVMEPAA